MPNGSDAMTADIKAQNLWTGLHFGEAGFIDPPPAALSVQSWVGGILKAGPGKKPEGDTICLTLCDFEGKDAAPSSDGAWWLGEQVLPGQLVAPQGARAIICNMMSIPAAYEEEFNDWYDTEHMPRIGALDGVIAARRFRSSRGTPAYAALYHLESLAVAQAPSWKAAANSPWTARILALRHDARRYGFMKEGIVT